jgi:tRNA/rRNA methyltransferase
MSGTNAAREAVWDPDGPAFILVRPQMGENIGAAARAMWNFGLRGLRLVAPRDGWPNPKAVAMASGAGGLLEEAMLRDTTAEAAEDLHVLYATTARPRDLAKTVMTPEAAVADMRARIAGGQRVGVLFGPERTGLETDDVVRANVIVTAPTNPAFASLNLAQSTLLMAYEWRRQGDAAPPVQPERGPMATQAEVGRVIDHLVAELDAARFFWPEIKREAMLANLANIFRRAPLTEQDARTLRGVIRALAEGPKRRR